MPNIDSYLAKIREAVYGEEVRGSIHDALAVMNNNIDSAQQTALRNSIAPAWVKKEYQMGEYVWYPTSDGTLYQAKQHIPATENWTPAHWQAISLATGLYSDVEKLVQVQPTQPTERINKIWIKDRESEVTVPTWDDHVYEDLKIKQTIRQDQYSAEDKKNLLLGIAWSPNSISRDDGSDIDNGYNVRTDDYIPIKPFGYINIRFTTDSSIAIRMFFYNSSKVFLGYQDSSAYTTNAETRFAGSIPSNAAYIRIVCHDESWSILSSPYEFASRLEVWIQEPFIYGNYVLDETIFQSGLSLSADGRAVSGSHALSDYIPIGAGTIIKCKPYSNEATYGDKWFPKIFNNNLIQTNGDLGWQYQYKFEEDCYIRLLLRSKDWSVYKLSNALSDMQILYVPPTNPSISKEILSGNMVHEMLDAITGKNLVENQLWEFGFIGKSGVNSLNSFLIRMRNSINVTKYASLRIQFLNNIRGSGRYIYYNADGSFNSYSNFTDVQTITSLVPDGARYFRLAFSSGWSVAVTPAAGKNVTIIGNERDNDDDLYRELYVPRINSAVSEYMSYASSERLGYIWISDIHLNTAQPSYTYSIFPRMIKAVRDSAEKANLDFIVIGGDIYDGEASSSNIYPMLIDAFEPLAGCSVPVLWLMGNHDDNAYGELLSKDLSISLIVKQSKFYNSIHYSDTEDGYFFFDIPEKRKRIVCLNSVDYLASSSGSSGRNWWSLSEKQVKWFCTDAVDTDYNIVILSHMLPLYNFNLWGHGDEGEYHTDLCNAISAYNSRESVTLYGTAYDFSASLGTIKFMHVGHTHIEYDSTICDIKAGGVECIVTGCAKQFNQAISENEIAVDAQRGIYLVSEDNYQALHENSYGWKYYHWANREPETINEALFDIVSADNTSVRCIRIGAGNSRTFSL